MLTNVDILGSAGRLPKWQPDRLGGAKTMSLILKGAIRNSLIDKRLRIGIQESRLTVCPLLISTIRGVSTDERLQLAT